MAKKNSKSTPAKKASSKVKSEQVKSTTEIKKNIEPVLTDVKVERSTKVAANSSKDTNKPLINLSPETSSKLISALVGFVAIVISLWVAFYYIPAILDQTDEAKAAKQREEQEQTQNQQKNELETKLAEESANLNFQTQNAKLTITNFGELNLDLNYDAAPKTVESFIRLVNRGYYNGTIFHRIVESDGFSVIQGGDPKGDGTGGEDAFGSTLPDELWKVEPTYTEDGSGAITNQPEFSDPSLYANFDTSTGQVTYRKGLIIMAKTSAPDSAGSQFFITLRDTTLPAQYTVFGVVNEANFSVLDKIYDEVTPLDRSTGEPTSDGRPSVELKLEKAELVG